MIGKREGEQCVSVHAGDCVEGGVRVCTVELGEQCSVPLVPCDFVVKVGSWLWVTGGLGPVLDRC